MASITKSDYDYYLDYFRSLDAWFGFQARVVAKTHGNGASFEGTCHTLRGQCNQEEQSSTTDTFRIRQVTHIAYIADNKRNIEQHKPNPKD